MELSVGSVFNIESKRNWKTRSLYYPNLSMFRFKALFFKLIVILETVGTDGMLFVPFIPLLSITGPFLEFKNIFWSSQLHH